MSSLSLLLAIALAARPGEASEGRTWAWIADRPSTAPGADRGRLGAGSEAAPAPGPGCQPGRYGALWSRRQLQDRLYVHAYERDARSVEEFQRRGGGDAFQSMYASARDPLLSAPSRETFE